MRRRITALRCGLQEVIPYDRRECGAGFEEGQQDAGSIDPALDRDGKFAVAGNERLAGTTVMPSDLVRCQAPDARRGTGRGGSGDEDHLALVAFPLSAADALERDPGLPYGFEHR